MPSSFSVFHGVHHAIPLRFRKTFVVGVVAIVLLLIQTGLGQAAFRVVGLSHPPTPFVQLYFPNARDLPSILPASERINVDFAIGNSRLTSHAFAWRVYQDTGGRQTGLATGRTVVGAGRTALVTRHLRLHCASKRLLLVVSVKRPSARIALWLTCQNSR